MNNSGMNTIILVLILGLIIFGMTWFYAGNNEQPQEGVNLELNLPADNSGSEDN